MISFLRVIKFAFQDVGRNISLSFMTIFILVLMLLSLNTFIFVQAVTEKAIQSVKDQIDVSVYFEPSVSDDDVRKVTEYVEAFPEVTNIIFHDRNEVLEQFKQTHKDNPEILASLSELNENPLGPTMIIKTREPKDYEKIMTALNVPEYATKIEAKTFGDTQAAIDRIHTITTNLKKFVFGLGALFTLIAFFVIFNTIRVAIYTQRTEISIKKLVGATNWFVRGPYLIEALLFSFLAVAMTSGIVYFFLDFVNPYVQVVFGDSAFLTNYYRSHILVLLGIQVGAVLFITVTTSLLAMRRYLRV